MTEETPRRLKRFKRKEEEEIVEEIGKEPLGKEPEKKRKEEVHLTVYRKTRELGGKPSIETVKEEVESFRKRKGRIPTGRELDEMAENLFEQVESGKIVQAEEGKAGIEGKEKGSEKRGRRNELEKAEEMLKKAVLGKEEKKESGEEIELIKEFDEKEEEKEKKEFGKGEKEEEEELIDEMKCPNCNAEGEPIFCPECGGGFCRKCTKEVKKIGTVSKFVCPHCKKEVKIEN